MNHCIIPISKELIKYLDTTSMFINKKVNLINFEIREEIKDGPIVEFNVLFEFENLLDFFRFGYFLERVRESNENNDKQRLQKGYEFLCKSDSKSLNITDIVHSFGFEI